MRHGAGNNVCDDAGVYLRWLIDTWILIPLNLIYLRTPGIYSGDCCGRVQFTEMMVRKTSPVLLPSAGDFLPLITTNCAVLGVALLNINLGHNFLQSALYGFFRRYRFLAGDGALRRHPRNAFCCG